MSVLAALALAAAAGCAALLAGTAVLYARAARIREGCAGTCRRDEDGPGARIPLVLQETASALALLAALPFGLRRRPMRAHTPGDRVPVVLVHGYLGTAANFFWLRRRLEREGWRQVHAVTLPPALSSIARAAERLAEAIARVVRETGTPEVDVVAHSMGGLVVRAMLRRAGGRGVVRRVITLGSPHQGTRALAWLGIDPMFRELRPDSPTLAALSAADPVPDLVDFVALYSVDDAVVIPPANAYYPGAFNIEVRGTGHRGLLVAPRIHDLVVENLVTGAPAARASTTG